MGQTLNNTPGYAKAESDYRNALANYERAQKNEKRAISDYEKISKRVEKDTPKLQANKEALRVAEKEAARLSEIQTLENMRTAADLVGIVDPTPISDGVSATISIQLGAYDEAAMSVVSCVPYLGDAVGKSYKGAKNAVKAAFEINTASKINKNMVALKRAADNVALSEKLINSQKTALATRNLRVVNSAIAKQQLELAKQTHQAMTKQASEIVIQNMKSGKTCDFGTVLPPRGSWTGMIGNSIWTSPKGEYKAFFKDGWIDMSKSRRRNPVTNQWEKVAHPDGSVKLVGMTGKGSDFTKARQAMREKTGNKYWPGVSAKDPLRNKFCPPNTTWHHEKINEMTLVYSNGHHAQIGGGNVFPAHSGGASITKSSLY